MSDLSNSSGRRTIEAEDALAGTVQDDRYLDRPHDLETVGDLVYVSAQAADRLNVSRLPPALDE